jgi:hypothetical protein
MPRFTKKEAQREAIQQGVKNIIDSLGCTRSKTGLKFAIVVVRRQTAGMSIFIRAFAFRQPRRASPKPDPRPVSSRRSKAFAAARDERAMLAWSLPLTNSKHVSSCHLPLPNFSFKEE